MGPLVNMQSESANFDMKSRTIFEVNESLLAPMARGYQMTRPFRDPAGLDISQKIASGLRQQGYEVTEPKNGKACDAVFRCKFKDFSITAVLAIDDRREGVVKCRLLTWKSRKTPLARLLQRDPPMSTAMEEQWKRLCSALDEQLRGAVGAEVRALK
jgi:hypothetical protein